MALITLFLTSFLAGSFIPVGSEVHFLYLQEQGEGIYQLLIAASLGNTLGGMSCYWIARYGGKRLIKKYLKHEEEKLNQWEARLKDKSEFMALLCWLPLVGELIATALGLVSKRTYLVMLLMFLGKLGRYLAISSFLVKLTA